MNELKKHWGQPTDSRRHRVLRPLPRPQERRLAKLADFLESLPPERFDLGGWIEGSTWDIDEDGCRFYIGAEHINQEEYRHTRAGALFNWLFMPSNYPGRPSHVLPVHVARRIRRVVARSQRLRMKEATTCTP